MLAMLHRLELLARVHGTVPALPDLPRLVPSAALKNNVLVWCLLLLQAVAATSQMGTLKAEVEKGFS